MEERGLHLVALPSQHLNDVTYVLYAQRQSQEAIAKP